MDRTTYVYRKMRDVEVGDLMVTNEDEPRAQWTTREVLDNQDGFLTFEGGSSLPLYADAKVVVVGSCPNDTNSDGDCGKRLCPHCGGLNEALS